MGSDRFSSWKHKSEPYRTGRPLLNTREVCSQPHTIHKRKQSQRVINDLDNVDFISSNNQSHQEALLYVFEDNEAVIKMIIGYLIESIWTPKSKSNTLTPKTNSQTY